MSFLLQEGDTFMFEIEGEPSVHLHVVVTDPAKDEEVLLVSVTSWFDLGDGTTILDADHSQHSFIIHRSYVSYADAKLASKQGLIKRFADGKLMLHSSRFPQPEYDRIVDGILNSPFTPRDIKAYYRSYVLNKA